MTYSNLVQFSAGRLVRIFTCLALLTLPAGACQICLPMPTTTLADRILAAKYLILAREDPQRPFHFKMIEELKGNSSSIPSNELFLDSSTRRRLENNPSLKVLCAWSCEENGWQRLVLLDQEIAPIIDAILKHRQEWVRNPDERVRFFAQHLNSENATIADLAHVEVARAPYRKVLECAQHASRSTLHKQLANPRRIKWHAMPLLMLSQSQNPEDHEYIRKGMARTADYGLSLKAAAWSTAWIEIDKQKALEGIHEMYLGNIERRPTEIAALHKALQTHGNEGHVFLRKEIVEIYGSMLEKYPDMAPDLAQDLTDWGYFEHAEILRQLLEKHPMEDEESMPIRLHLEAADKQFINILP